MLHTRVHPVSHLIKLCAFIVQGVMSLIFYIFELHFSILEQFPIITMLQLFHFMQFFFMWQLL